MEQNYNVVQVLNHNEHCNSLQISVLDNIPAGNFNINGGYFLIKNITDENIKASIKMADSKTFIETVLYPGWNVELVQEIKNVQPNTLQYGY